MPKSNGRGPAAGTARADEGLLRARADGVFGFLEGVIGALAVPAGHRGLLLVHLEEGRAQAAESPGGMACAQLPLLVHAALTGEEGPALPVAGACTLLYLGADLFDNLADEELPDRWLSYHPSEASLAAATYLSALPPLSLAHLEERGASPGRLWVLSRLFADALLKMSAGQREDLVSAERMTLAGCRELAEGKSGAEIGLFAEAGAVLATDDPWLRKTYASFGTSMGTAGQIASDLRDIWEPGTSRDLLNGKKTLPVVHALAKLRGGPRDHLLALLAAARDPEEPHEEVRETLLRAGSLRYAAFVVEVYRRRTLACLEEAAPRGPAGDVLRALAEDASLLTSTRGPVRGGEAAPV